MSDNNTYSPARLAVRRRMGGMGNREFPCSLKHFGLRCLNIPLFYDTLENLPSPLRRLLRTIFFAPFWYGFPCCGIFRDISLQK